jgi:hypothetical protein
MFHSLEKPFSFFMQDNQLIFGPFLPFFLENAGFRTQ